MLLLQFLVLSGCIFTAISAIFSNFAPEEMSEKSGYQLLNEYRFLHDDKVDTQKGKYLKK